ncbi:MAG: amidohydrolase, partial [Pseudomonadota bacterium]
MRRSTILAAALLAAAATPATADNLLTESLTAAGDQYESQVIEWRRWFHENPELSNQEFETAKKVAAELKAMGLTPELDYGGTGVVAMIEGGLPGPIVALRADMDGLPVKEEVDLPFASKARGDYRGQSVPVMHACGHDTHMAMLLGAARALVDIRESLPGSVMLIFQPAEEGVGGGVVAGAERMLAEGLFEGRKPAAVFGLHTFSGLPAQMVAYRSGPAMASADRFEIRVRGKQTHGSRPWGGV